MSNKTDLLAIGHTAFDYILQVNEFPQPNSSTSINKMKTLFGGAAANVAVVASSLGLTSSLVSAVGNDFIGSKYQNKLKDLGIDIGNMIVIEDEKTPTAFGRFLRKHFDYGAHGNILDTMMCAINGAQTRVAEASAREADLVLRPLANDASWHDFTHPQKYIALGRAAAEGQLAEVRRLVEATSYENIHPVAFPPKLAA